MPSVPSTHITEGRTVSFYMSWCLQQCLSMMPPLMFEWKNECVKEYVALYASEILKCKLYLQKLDNMSNKSLPLFYFSFVWVLEKMFRRTNKSAVLNLGYQKNHPHTNYSRMSWDRTQFLSLKALWDVSMRNICWHCGSILATEKMSMEVVGTQVRWWWRSPV